MSKLAVKRLKKLKKVIKRIPAININMKEWYCQTTACALGHYCNSKEGQDDGWNVGLLGKCPRWQGWMGYRAAIEYFHINRDNAYKIFSPDSYPKRITKAEIIRRIDEVIGGNDEKD